MTIFRNKKDGYLYTIQLVSPRQYLGEWYEATPLFEYQGKFYKNAHLKDFVAIAHR